MRKLILLVIAFISLSGLTTPSYAKDVTHSLKQPTVNYTVTGRASYYGSESGSTTANGEHFNPMGLTAAHRTLPFGTVVKVTNLKNDKVVFVRINDRGPFVKGRIIDLSKGAAKKIGLDGVGLVKVSSRT